MYLTKFVAVAAAAVVAAAQPASAFSFSIPATVTVSDDGQNAGIPVVGQTVTLSGWADFPDTQSEKRVPRTGLYQFYEQGNFYFQTPYYGDFVSFFGQYGAYEFQPIRFDFVNGKIAAVFFFYSGFDDEANSIGANGDSFYEDLGYVQCKTDEFNICNSFYFAKLDFSNASVRDLPVAGVPEPTTWLFMTGSFCLIGFGARWKRHYVSRARTAFRFR